MLGRGRPFIVEFMNPKKSISCLEHVQDIAKLINSDVVTCHDFKIVDKKFFDELKDIENSKAKAYCCVVWVKKRVSEKELEQKLNTLSNLAL